MDTTRTVTIFGKDTWPHTTRAREAHAQRGDTVDYRDVTKSAGDLEEMLRFSKGRREVPVIVEDGRVTIGYGGT